jgi:hypothetical protein
LILLYRHSGEGRARSEALSAIQVDSGSWFSICRFKSGMWENFGLSSYLMKGSYSFYFLCILAALIWAGGMLLIEKLIIWTCFVQFQKTRKGFADVF